MKTKDVSFKIYAREICVNCINKDKELCEIRKCVNYKNCITYKCINYKR